MRLRSSVVSDTPAPAAVNRGRKLLSGMRSRGNRCAIVGGVKLALALVLAACGSSSPAPSFAVAPSSPTAATVAGSRPQPEQPWRCRPAGAVRSFRSRSTSRRRFTTAASRTCGSRQGCSIRDRPTTGHIVREPIVVSGYAPQHLAGGTSGVLEWRKIAMA